MKAKSKMCDNPKCSVRQHTGIHSSDFTYCYKCGESLTLTNATCCDRDLSVIDNFCPMCGLSREEIVCDDKEKAEQDHLNHEENLRHKEQSVANDSSGDDEPPTKATDTMETLPTQ